MPGGSEHRGLAVTLDRVACVEDGSCAYLSLEDRMLGEREAAVQQFRQSSIRA